VSRYKLTPKARAGLADILEYAAYDFGPRVAEDVLDRHVAAFERLADSPGIGHVRPDITSEPNVRFWSVGPSLIAYRRSEDTIEILFVERGQRDWARLFGAED
jgi:toxin ParE1/3/4